MRFPGKARAETFQQQNAQNKKTRGASQGPAAKTKWWKTYSLGKTTMHWASSSQPVLAPPVPDPNGSRYGTLGIGQVQRISAIFGRAQPNLDVNILPWFDPKSCRAGGIGCLRAGVCRASGDGLAGRRTLRAGGDLAAGVARPLRPPSGPGRAICALCGLMSAAAQALERRPCEPTGRMPPSMLLQPARRAARRRSGGNIRVCVGLALALARASLMR